MNRGMKMVIVAVLLACAAGSQGALAASASGKAASAKETIQAPQTKMPEEAKTADTHGAQVSINNASAEELAQAYERRWAQESAGNRQLPRRIWAV